MGTYILKRLLISVVILFFVMFIIYALMRSLPTSYIQQVAAQRSTFAGTKSYTEWMEELKVLYKLDRGIIAGFFGWLSDIITRGDFGESWYWAMPVVAKFKESIWYSFALSAFAMFFELLIAIPLGIIAARKQYSKTDYTITIVALLGISLPSFFLSTIMKLVFGMRLAWVDYVGVVSREHPFLTPFGQILDYGKHYIMPVFVLTFISIGSMMRYTRSNMLEVLNADYIRTARSKGLSERRVINHHAFRNTLVPIVTMVGAMLPSLFGGALITETLFQIPGIGYVSYQSMTNGDIPFSMFFMTFLAVLTLLGTLISDILYAVVDPRVRIA